MSRRTLIRLIGAAAVLAAVWLLVALLSGPRGSTAADASGLSAALEGISPSAVGAIRVTGGPESVALVRRDDRWTVNGTRADSGLVAGFLDAISRAAVVELVARNPQNHARMGVTADAATRLVIEADGDSSTLLVGNSGTGYGTAFVRLPDDDLVYLVEGGIRSHVVRTIEGWRDKRIVALDTAAVDRVHVRREGDEYVLARAADSAWSVDGEPAEPGAVRDLLSELADLRASGFLAATDSLAMEAAGSWITAMAASGDTLAMLTLGEGEMDRWLRSAGDSVIYRLPSWRADRLAPAPGAVSPASR